MKYSLTYCLLLILNMVTLWSCSSDDYEEVGDKAEKYYTGGLENDLLVVRMLDGSDTRTALDADGSPVWAASDELYGVNASARINALNLGVFHGIPTGHFTLASDPGQKNATFMGEIWQKDSCMVNFLYPYSYTKTYASSLYNDKTYENYANPDSIPITVLDQRCTLESMLAHDYLTAQGEIMDKAIEANFERRVAWMKVSFTDTLGNPFDLKLYGMNQLRVKASTGFFIAADTLCMSNPAGIYSACSDTAKTFNFSFSPDSLEIDSTGSQKLFSIYLAFIPSGVETQIDMEMYSRVASYGGSFKPVTLEANNFYHGTMGLTMFTHAEGGYKNIYYGVESTSVAAAGDAIKDDYHFDDISMKMYGVTKDNYDPAGRMDSSTMSGTKYDYTSPWDSVNASGFTAYKDDYGAIYAVLDYMMGYKLDYSPGEESGKGLMGFYHEIYDIKDAEYTPFTGFLHSPYGEYEDSRGWFIKLLKQDYDDYEDARGWFIKVLHPDYNATEDARSWFIELMKHGYISPWTIYAKQGQEAGKDGYDNGQNKDGNMDGTKDGYIYNK